MIVCPVCEHPQAQGDECDVCGKRLRAPATVAVTTAPVEGLELTAVVATNTEPSIWTTGLPELEATRAAPVAATELLPPPELEPTVQPRAPDAPIAALPELETGRYVDTEPKTALATDSVTCRYCKNVQSSGAICERCGMRLPRVAQTGSAAVAGEVTCTDCGTVGPPGRLCRACGARLPSGDST